MNARAQKKTAAPADRDGGEGDSEAAGLAVSGYRTSDIAATHFGARSYFVIERLRSGWWITVHRRGRAPERTQVSSRGEANQVSRYLLDAGLPGYVVGGAE